MELQKLYSTMTISHSIDHQAAFMEIGIDMRTDIFKHKIQNSSKAAKN
jgi:hypothetical protein